jgi:hypothetical protein
VQIKEEIVEANKKIKITVLYDFLPARCAARTAEWTSAIVPSAPHAITFKERGCHRELSFQFEHNRHLPQGEKATCATNKHLFADGLPGDTQARAAEVDLRQQLSSEDFKLLAATTGGPAHLTFDWQTCGHPPDAWKKPHYDLHIYKVNKVDRPPACINAVYAGYVCKEKDDPKYFQYGPAADQVLEGMTADTSGIVRQGNHWAVRPVRDPNFREPEIVFMSYDSKIVAYETMIPVVWLSESVSRNYTFAYKNVSALPAGWHPVQIKEEIVKANKEIKITVLYDFFPARASKCFVGPDEPVDSKGGVASFFSLLILFASVLIQF